MKRPGKVFFFINRFRVEEAKSCWVSPRVGELNILGIAFAAGFNPKTAFNTALKNGPERRPASTSGLKKSG